LNIKETFFKYRSYSPIPLIIAALILAKTTWQSYLFGFALACIGEAIRIWAVFYAGGATRTTGRVGGDELVTNGPFAYVRNPLYFGNFILSLGLLIMAWPWMPLLLVIYLAVFAIQYSCIISLEEQYLWKNFGETYQQYFKSVPRFFPTFQKYGKGSRSPIPLAKALYTERNTLQSFAFVSLAILLRWLLV
jgi:protein-S-isoprenylcysteine O-methyltransferase Ste14